MRIYVETMPENEDLCPFGRDERTFKHVDRNCVSEHWTYCTLTTCECDLNAKDQTCSGLKHMTLSNCGFVHS